MSPARLRTAVPARGRADATRRAILRAGGLAAAGLALPRQSWSSPGVADGAGALVRSIDGPLVSTGDLARQRELFEGVFGLRPVAEQKLSAAEVKALWGVPARAAATVLLETPGATAGVRLVAFEPLPPVSIRDGAAGVDCDALKVIDFAIEDWDAAVAAVKARGFELAGPPAEYSLPREGRFAEGHVRGPDGVVCALLQFKDSPRGRFVRVTDRVFSEVLACSAPVADLAAAKGFYSALGLGVVLEYRVETESFQKLVGSKAPTHLTGTNLGLSEKAPMIGLVHYGLPAGTFRSLRDRSILPNRGTAALRLGVASVDAVAAACRARGDQVLAPPARVVLAPYGEVRSLCVRAPHGVVHHLLETG